MKITVISNGMGSQSKLLPLLLYEKDERLKEYWDVDLILNIFSDTGDEPEEIYKDLIDYQIYLHEHNYPQLIAITRKDFYNMPENTMSEYYLAHGIIPTRQFRHCTDKFKIQVIRKYLSQYKGSEINMLIGFTLEESHRMRDSDVKWIINQFPFIYNLKYTRDDCIKELAKRNIESHKSGCWFCPFLSKKRFYEYVKDKPTEKKLIIAMEGKALLKNNKMTLFDTPIKRFIHNKEMQTDLSKWLESDSCDSGHCFV